MCLEATRFDDFCSDCRRILSPSFSYSSWLNKLLILSLQVVIRTWFRWPTGSSQTKISPYSI